MAKSRYFNALGQQNRSENLVPCGSWLMSVSPCPDSRPGREHSWNPQSAMGCGRSPGCGVKRRREPAWQSLLEARPRIDADPERRSPKTRGDARQPSMQRPVAGSLPLSGRGHEGAFLPSLWSPRWGGSQSNCFGVEPVVGGPRLRPRRPCLLGALSSLWPKRTRRQSPTIPPSLRTCMKTVTLLRLRCLGRPRDTESVSGPMDWAEFLSSFASVPGMNPGGSRFSYTF